MAALSVITVPSGRISVGICASGLADITWSRASGSLYRSPIGFEVVFQPVPDQLGFHQNRTPPGASIEPVHLPPFSHVPRHHAVRQSG